MKQTDTIRNDKTQQRYGFYGRLTQGFPSQLNIDTTEHCNFACIHCLHQEFERSDRFSGAFLSPELNAKMVEEVRTHGQGMCQHIRYSAEGETLLHPNFFDLIEYTTANAGCMVSVTTNGSIMTEACSERLVAANVDLVDISLDAFTNNTYAQIRRGGDLDVTRANVLRLLATSQNNGGRTRVVVSFVEQPLNRHEVRDFESFWKDNGVDYVVIRRLHSQSGAVEQTAIALRKRNAHLPRRPCLYPWERMVLNPRGALSFCPADWTFAATVADYCTTSIQETWQGMFYQKLRRAHLNNDYCEAPYCGQCPDWAETRWPQDGRSYADMIEEFKR